VSGRVVRVLAAAALAWAAGAAAEANDSTAEIAAGGLVFTKSAEIEMRSEGLFISAKEIRVAYSFVNTSGRDVRVRVAFPLPDLDGALIQGDSSIPDPASDNFVDFATLIDGHPVHSAVEHRAVLKGKDVSQTLRALALPLDPLDQTHMDGRWAKLNAGQRKSLLAQGLVADGECGEDCAQWTLKTTYWWEQLFPAGRSLSVEHRYRPVVGESAGAALAYLESSELQAYRAKYCIDDAFMAAVARLKRANPNIIGTEQRIDYVLKTGANWKTPIGSFRLVVDKGAPRNLISFCASGLRKIGPTRFELRRSNFRPDRDLSILIIRPPGPHGG